ncbi:MAG TPA: DUF1232 domain-containing protein [Caldithrix sp.]|nr:DUF1232 domain-containing protein [Caldithrix sp.]
MEEPRGFQKAKEAAERLAREQEKLQSMIQRAVEKAERQKGKITDFWQDLQVLIRMVRSYFKKEYTNIPWKTIIFALAAIIYFLNPFDAVPDVIPGVGFLDDATVIAFVISALKDELEKFKQSTAAPYLAESK